MSELLQHLRRVASAEVGFDYGDLWGYCAEAADEIERLRAERDALREDAERYRWLRSISALSLWTGPLIYLVADSTQYDGYRTLGA